MDRVKVDNKKFQEDYHDKEKFFDTILARTDKSEQAIKLITLMDIAWSLRVIARCQMEQCNYYFDYSDHYVDGNFEGSKADKVYNKKEEEKDDSEV